MEIVTIGVLVAISIPIFTTQLEKSRDAVSISNLRAAYAEASAAYLTAGDKAVTEGDVEVKAPDADVKVVVTVKNVDFKGVTASDKFSGNGANLPFSNAADLAEPAAGKHTVSIS